MPNPLYKCVLNIYDLKTHLVDNILKIAWVYFFLSQLNGFKYFYLLPIICPQTDDLKNCYKTVTI